MLGPHAGGRVELRVAAMASRMSPGYTGESNHRNESGRPGLGKRHSTDRRLHTNDEPASISVRGNGQSSRCRKHGCKLLGRTLHSKPQQTDLLLWARPNQQEMIIGKARQVPDTGVGPDQTIVAT